MPNYNMQDIPRLSGIKSMLARITQKIETLDQSGTSIKAVTSAGNTLKFFNTTDTTVTPTYTIDLPAEMFLDEATTRFVSNFEFSSATYPGATNPNLDGKAVMVLGVKTKSNDGLTQTVSYSFIDVSYLSDVYTAGDTTITIANYQVTVRLSALANNAITVQNDGLHVDISGKIDKVTTATSGNLVTWGTAGAVLDSGSRLATDAEFTAMLDEVFPTLNGG